MKFIRRLMFLFSQGCTATRLFTKMIFQIIYGLWKLSRISAPRVTFFGGHAFKQDDYYAKKATELATILYKHGYSVITGGGPGIMEAANCGVFENEHGKIRTMGIGIENLPEEKDLNRCVLGYGIKLNSFYARKFLMMSFSDAFIFFPGGYGTLDEFGELLTLMKTKKIPQKPVVLYDSKFWGDFENWIKDKMLENNLIKPEEYALVHIIDDINNIIKALKK